MTAPAGDFAIRPLGPGEEEPAAPHPLPLHHHFGYSAGTRFGVLTDFQEGRVPLSDPSSGGHLSLPLCPSPMTLRCLEPSRNGAEGTRSQWGTAGSAEEPSPEAARLAKALRELSQTGRERNGRDACERGCLPTDAAGGCAGEACSWKVGPRWEAKKRME